MELFDSIYGFLHTSDSTQCLLTVLLVMMVFLVMGFRGTKLWLWSICLFVVSIGFHFPIPLIVILALGLLVLNITPLRKVLLSAPVMSLMKALKLIPQISQTEKEALEAGVVWIDKELFSGKPDFKMMMNEPYPELTQEEKAFLDGPTEKLCSILNDWEIWQQRKLPDEAWKIIKEEKFLGMIISKKYGGLEFSAYAHGAVIAKISSCSIPACITVMVPNSLGPAELLSHYGTEEQRQKWLPGLATGEEIPCFALTEPGAGSDAGSIEASGVVFKDSNGEIKIRLNWNKRWITLASIATVLGMAFRLFDPENLLGNGEDVGITCALVPSDIDGVVIGRRHDPLGVPFHNCPTQGKDVIIDLDQIIGGVANAGKGWLMLMESLGAGRGISLPSQGVGGSQMLLRATGAHSAIRKQFGLSIGKFEGVEEPLARMNGFAYMIEACRDFTCGALDAGIKPPVITAIAKYTTTEMARVTSADAMDVLGGAGISLGQRNVAAHTHIASPIAITVEGANILTRTLMIFGQGAMRAHPFAFEEVRAVENNDLSAFDKAFWGHQGHIVRNLFRCVLLSVTRGKLAGGSNYGGAGGSLTKYAKRLSWVAASYATMTDIAMVGLGGQLKIKEKLTGRYADILSWMYLSYAVMRRWKAEGEKKEDLPIVEYSLRYAMNEMQKAFDGIHGNITVPGLTWLFRGPVRWWSRVNSLSSAPHDKLVHNVARLTMVPGEQRDRLTKAIYQSKDIKQSHIAELDDALIAMNAAEAIERKIKKAIRSKVLPKKRVKDLVDLACEKSVISAEEKDLIATSEKKRWNCIQVDDFSEDDYLSHQG